jgi:hypothetical protein
MSEIRTYKLDHYTVPDPDGCNDVVLTRPLSVTVGTQALEPGIEAAKTLLRFALSGNNPLLERPPKMLVRIFPRLAKPGQTRVPVSFEDPLFVELLFDNTSFVSERKEMPLWLVEVLEFAAESLRTHHILNQKHMVIENIE